MLTIHDCTFQVRWRGWGAFMPQAERVAMDIMVDLLGMSPSSIRQLARSAAERELTRKVALSRLASMLACRGRPMPRNADIVLEVM